MERLFGTVMGWLIGLGMVVFALVGFMAINQATPLSSKTFLSSPTKASATPGTTTTTGPSSSTSSQASGATKGKGTTGKGAKSGGTQSPAQLAALGQTIITAKCEVCHVINGTGGNLGPNLDKVMAGQTVPKMVPGGQPTQTAWLTKWIANPQAVWPQAIMPNLGLTSQQVQEVVAYLKVKVK